MEYEKSASGSVYLIKSDKGYWLPGGFGYTSNKAEAGRFSVADMASPDAVRQARYAERMKAKGMRQRKFWLTDDEYEALRECLEELRAAQGGGSDPASA